MPPAARVGDFHSCPLETPGLPPVPHVGGPIDRPGAVTVFIGELPAARAGDFATCVAPPPANIDLIVQGSTSVFIMGLPAARMGDETLHGGKIIAGDPMVMIGG